MRFLCHAFLALAIVLVPGRAFAVGTDPQTISFFQIPNVSIRDTPPAPLAFSSSGLNVSFTSATPATCSVASSGSVQFNDVGTCTIIASQPGDNTYAAAPDVTQSFNILIPQKIEFDKPADTAFSTQGPPIIAGAVNDLNTHPNYNNPSLPVTFLSSTQSVCTITSDGQLTMLSVGKCTIIVLQAGNDTYAPADTVSQSFKIGKGSNKIYFPDPSNVTLNVSPKPQMYASATSGLPVTYTSNSPSVCSINASGEVTPVSVGQCVILAAQAGNSNYFAASSVLVSFNITDPLYLIAFPEPSLKKFGSPPQTLAATSTSGQPVVTYSSSTPSVCTVSGTAVSYVAPGICSVTASQTFNTPVTISFTVTNGAGTIFFATPADTPFNSTPPTLNATTPTGLTISYSSNTTNVCSVTSAGVLTFLTAGTCSITASHPASASYSAASETQSFKILSTSNVITFPALPNTPFTSTPPTLGATSTSGLAIQYASNTTSICGLNSNTIVFLSAGTCTIKAQQPGNSGIAAATPVSQSFQITAGTNTITFPQPADITFGKQAPALQATASSSLPVSYTSATSAVCSVTAQGAVTILTPGTCSIAASQAGNTNYAAAVSVTRSFNILVQSSAISFAQPPDTPFTSAPPLLSAVSLTNQTVTFTSSSAACSVTSTGTLTFLAVGTCTIEASQAAGVNGQAAQQSRSFQITPGANVITFPSLAATPFTSTPPTLAATASSNLPVSYASNTASTCTVSGSAITFVSGGQCSITASQGGNSNFAPATTVTRVFNITVSVNVITFDKPADTLFTDSPPALTATASSNLPVTYRSNSSRVCTVTSAGVITFVSGGDCSITAYQVGNAAYRAAQPVTKTFTIQVGNNIITFAQPANTPFTSKPPVLSASATSGLPISFSSSTPNVCTVTTGGAIKFVKGGACTIIANQAGDLTYQPATPITRTFAVLPGSNVISFKRPSDRILSAAAPVLGATASSGLAVTYVSKTPSVCSVTSGGTVKLLVPGTCTIAASQAGNVSYAAAVPVSQSFVVKANPTSTVASSGLKSRAIIPATRSATALYASNVVPLLGQPVVLTAKVTPTPNAGTVEFRDGTTPICSAVALSGATATCTVSFSTGGAHDITAAYSGSTKFEASVSEKLVIKVKDQRGRTAETIAQFTTRRNDLLLANSPDQNRDIDRLIEAGNAASSSNTAQGSNFAPGIGMTSTARSGSQDDTDVATMAFGGRQSLASASRAMNAAEDAETAAFSARGLQFGASAEGAARYSFSTSLSAIVRANEADDKRKAAEAGLNFANATTALPSVRRNPFDIWVDARYLSFEDPSLASNENGHFGLVSVGADYVATPSLLIGLMAQFDSMSVRSEVESTETKGKGWLVGPYMTARLSNALFWQVRGAWGETDNEVSPFLTYTDNFTSSRWLASSSLTGRWTSGAWTFSPSAAVSYIEDTTESYKDTFGITISSITSRLGQAKIGPEIAYAFRLSSGMIVEPHAAIQLIWNFANEGEAAGLGSIDSEAPGSATVRGRTELGLRAKTVGGIAVGISGSYDGIGAEGFSAIAGKAALAVPLN